MAAPLITLCLTHNLASFSLFGTLAPPTYIMRRIVWHIFPRDDRDYKLDDTKIRHNKKRVPD